jgi:hypothetical protein
MLFANFFAEDILQLWILGQRLYTLGSILNGGDVPKFKIVVKLPSPPLAHDLLL